MNFDVISDIHIEFWVKWDGEKTQARRIQQFVESILPNNPSDVLLIAGDLGHHNQQIFLLLQVLKKFYKTILLVEGNHDLYLRWKDIQRQFHYNSLARYYELRRMAESLKDVYYLDGTIQTVNGVRFGGCGMWYDYSFGIKRLGHSWKKMHALWHNEFKDSDFLFGVPSHPSRYYAEQRKKLEAIIDDSDVIVTHVGPDWSHVPSSYARDPITAFYYFDGSDLSSRLEEKIWVFGHSHVRYDYEKGGCRFVNGSLGFPGKEAAGRKIITLSSS